MGKRIDLTGQTFGRLKVIRKAGVNKRGEVIWECSCFCGKITNAKTYQLKHGGKKSCGCLSVEKTRERRTVHGEWGTRLHQLWKGIKSRCYNPNHAYYKNYGGRGIKVCPEWKEDFLQFKNFMISIGYDETLPTGEQTIERIDVNGDYEPNNCKLVSRKEQNINKRNNHKVTYKGETKTVTEFAEEYGLDVENVLNRINNYGYSIEEAIEKPVRKCSHKNAPLYEVDGEKFSLREWGEKFGLTRSQIKSKTRHKSVEEVVRELKAKQRSN